MKRSVWKWVNGLLIGSAFIGAAAAQAPGAPADSYYMNDRKLTIPITLPSALRKEIAKLSLFVSSDQGKTWRQEATAAPSDESFQFDAAADGSYWFNVSYTDKAGQSAPKESEIYSGPPQLKVMVDTKRPLLKLETLDRAGDVVTLAWEAKDEALDAATLKLEWKAEGSADWSQLDLGSAATGQKRFTLGTSANAALKLFAQDKAGNQSMVQAEVKATAAPAPKEAAATTNAAAKPVTAKATSMATEPPALPAPSSVSNAAPPTLAPSAPPSLPPSLPPASGDTFRPAGPAPAVPAGNMSVPSAANQPIASSAPAVSSMKKLEAPPAAPSAAGDSRAIASSQPIGSSSPLASASYAPAGRQGGVPAVFASHTRLELDYEIPKMGPSGVGSVELWVTQDNGRNWRKAGDKQEALPPFVYEAPGEGVYGFMMIVKSKAGLGRKEPTAGDAPDLRVEIDATPPMATLFPVEADPRRKDMLFLVWKAEDRNLAQNPVRLEWAEKQGGPWTAIGSDLPNTGKYPWRMPEQMPYRIFLRLEVRDQAGNVSVAETPEPVLVDLTEPEIRIKGLLPNARKQ